MTRQLHRVSSHDLSRPYLGMVAAFQWEVRHLLRKQNGAKQLNSALYSFLLGGDTVLLAIAGAGPQNSFRAAHELVQNFSLRGLTTLGFAGALAQALRPGDIILADQVLEEETQQRFECQTELLPVRLPQRGTLLSVAGVVGSSAEKRRLGARWGAIAADMESAGVARVAARAGLPFCAVKSITDSSEQSISIDFERCRSEDGGLSFFRIVREAMTTLQGTRDLWRLAWSCRRAAGSLATALG